MSGNTAYGNSVSSAVLATLPDGEIPEEFELIDLETQSVNWNFDGRLLAVSEDTGRIKIVDLSTNREWKVGVGVAPTEFAPSFQFSPTENTIALRYDDDTIELWDAVTGRFLRVLDTAPETLARWQFSPDGTLISAEDGDYLGYFYLWDVETGQLLHAFEAIEGVPLESAVSPDGRLFMVHQVFLEDQFWLWRLDEEATP